MGTSKNQAQDKATAIYLKKKLCILHNKKQRIELELKENGFNVETYRQLNITQLSIECCENRLNGKFKYKYKDEIQVVIPNNIQ